MLIPYWIDPHRKYYLGFGVTAFSMDDAVQILGKFGYALPPIADCVVREHVTFVDLDQRVRSNMGPIVVRGLWYPFHYLGMPDWSVS